MEEPQRRDETDGRVTPMELYLVRHGIAFEHDPARWPDDRDRPLTDEGESKFRRAARGLERIVGSVDVVLSSPLIRAWRTAELLGEEAGWPAPVVCEALEPDRTAAAAVTALDAYRRAERVALVGHERLLGEVIGHLLGEGVDAIPLKKGGAAMIELTGDDAELRWLLTPKIERVLGK